MRHKRGENRKILNKKRAIEITLRNHNKQSYDRQGNQIESWLSVDDIPESIKSHIFRDEAKRTEWHCSPNRCEYCLMSRMHKHFKRDEAFKYDKSFWNEGGHELLEDDLNWEDTYGRDIVELYLSGIDIPY